MEWFSETWSTTWEWIKERDTLFAWIGALSLITLIVSAVAVPMVIRRMPSDYFLDSSEEAAAIREQHPVLRIFFLIVKNLIGGILVIGGLIMFVTPGQGLLTVVIGLILMDFPGKRRLEVRLVRFGPLNKAINWIRRRANQPPLELPDT
jgi:hypothetical protein